MDFTANLDYEEYEFLYSWKKVEEILRERPNYRLPNAVEAAYIDFKHHATWISETINGKHCIVDMNFGPQVTYDGKYGLILIKDNDGKNRY